jgi:Xaa-Pro aminopeptidase
VQNSKLSEHRWDRAGSAAVDDTAFVSPEYLESSQVALESAYGGRLRQLEAERRGRLIAFLDEHGLDQLVIFGSAAPGQKSAIRFATNYSPSGQQVCVVVGRDGRITLGVVYSAHFAWALHMTWADHVVLITSVQEIASEVERLAAPGARIGVARLDVLGHAVATDLVAWLTDRFGTVADVTTDLTSLVREKSPLEIQLVRVTGALAGRALDEAGASIEPGMSEPELVGATSSTLWAGGAEAVTLLVGSGGGLARPQALPRRFATDDGIQLSVEIAGPGGYWVQAVRTYQLGVGLPGLDALIATAEQAEQTLQAQLRAGEPIRRLAEFGLPTDSTDAVPLWHGMGLEMGEPPLYLSPGDGVWQPGMVVAIHPNLFRPPAGCFLGNTYIVTDGDPICATVASDTEAGHND